MPRATAETRTRTAVTNGRRLRADGIEIVYDEAGAGERPFVLVHGFTGHRQDFATQLPALAGTGRTLAPDLRGHGDSTHTGERASYSFSTLVDDLSAFLDALAIERCDLLGHSMGGMLVLRFALAHPERTQSLVLMNTGARAPDGISLETFELACRVAEEGGMPKLQELMRARIEADPERSPADRRLETTWGAERYWNKHRARICATDPVAYVALGRAIFEQESLLPRLAEISVPTLVLVGAYDREFGESSAELAKGIAGAEWVTIPDAGHHPQLESPQAWRSAIRAHLARARGG